MKYKIIWKRKNTIYTEYLDIIGLKSCLDFIDKSDIYELISVTPDED